MQTKAVTSDFYSGALVREPGEHLSRESLSDSELVAKGETILRNGSDMAAYAAYRLFRAATKRAPTSARPFAMASWCFCLHRNPDPGHPYLAPAELRRMAHRAVKLAGDDAVVLSIAAHALAHFDEDRTKASALSRRAIALGPTSATLFRAAGWISLYRADSRSAIEHFQHASNLDADDNYKHFNSLGLAIAYLLTREIDAALSWARRSVSECPHSSLARQCLKVVDSQIASDRAWTYPGGLRAILDVDPPQNNASGEDGGEFERSLN